MEKPFDSHCSTESQLTPPIRSSCVLITRSPSGLRASTKTAGLPAAAVKMGDLAGVNSCLRRYKEGTVLKGRQLRDLPVPPPAICCTVTTSARQLRDTVRRCARGQGGYASCRVPCEAFVRAKEVPLNSASGEDRQIAKCTERSPQHLRSEVPVVPAHTQTVSFPPSLPLSVTEHPAVSQYGCVGRHTFPSVPSIQPVAPRACPPAGVLAAPAWQPASTGRAVVAVDLHKSMSAASTSVCTSTSRGCILSSSADGNICFIKDSKPHAAGLAVPNNGDNCNKTRPGNPGPPNCEASRHSTSSEPTRSKCIQRVQYSAPQHTLSSHSWRISPPPVFVSGSPASHRPAYTPISGSAFRKSATCPLPETSHPRVYPQELEKLKREDLPNLLQSVQEPPTLPSHQQAKSREMADPCIADIRPPPLQHGNVLFCSYCGKRLVRRKSYMPCWPEFLFCDSCALLPRCSVCHRKALPAYILSHSFSDSKDSTRMSPIKSSAPEASYTNRSSCAFSKCHNGSSERRTARILCEPIHDAEGLHLCGHCALLNPVNTQECLLRLTQCALLWLQERHGLVFSKERLAVQKNPLVQQQMQKSMLLHDRLHRSASTPEVLLPLTRQHNKTNNELIKRASDESHVPRLEIHCSPRVASYPLRIDSSESVRPAQRLTQQESSRTELKNEDASMPLRSATLKNKPKGCTDVTQILAQSIQQLFDSGHVGAKHCLTKNDVRPAARQPNGESCRSQPHQPTPGEEKHGRKARMQNFPTRQEIYEIREKEGYPRQQLFEGNLGFAVDAVGFASLNVGEKSNVFGRCETERLHYDDLLLPLQTQREKIEQRHILEEAVQLSRGDAITAACGRGVAMQRRYREIQQSLRQPGLLPTTGERERSLHCIRRVAVLRYLPETVFLSHLVHELVHAYIWCAQPAKERKMLLQVEEGICNAVSASFLEERLETLAFWETQLAHARHSGKRGEQGGSQQGSAVRVGTKKETTREASAPMTGQDEPLKIQADLGAWPAATEGEASTGCITAAIEGAPAMEARVGADVLRQRIDESEKETDADEEEGRELLLLLVRYEARVLRTRLNDMEADEHVCYGKGYRVMRQIVRDIQLQQTLHVAARYGCSLEAVEQAATYLRSRDTNNTDTDTIGPPLERCTICSCTTAGTKRDNSHVPGTFQWKVSPYTTSPCQEAGRLWYMGVAAAQRRNSFRASSVGDAEQHVQCQRQSRRPPSKLPLVQCGERCFVVQGGREREHALAAAASN